MKKPKNLIAIGLLSLLSGCLPSINPLYTDEDLAFNSDLIGTWSEEESKERWTFEKTDDKEYKLTHSDDDDQATFSAHLVRIGETDFLDIYPADLKSDNYLYETHLYPVHTFSKVRIDKDQVKIQMFGSSWIEEQITSKQIDVAHVNRNGSVLLTASTKDLQKLVLDHANNEDAFRETLVLTKKN